jgi:hypothetical protein
MEKIPKSYIFVTLVGKVMTRLFCSEYEDRDLLRSDFKKLDSYRATLSPEQQFYLNVHIWGEYEMEMMKSEKALIFVAPDIDWLIEQCRRFIQAVR